jgi:HEAT repeat protein
MDIEKNYHAHVLNIYNRVTSSDLSDKFKSGINELSLKKIFVKLTVALPDEPSYDEEDNRLTRNVKKSAPEPISIATALHQYHRLIIIGAPGSGKTTLLRWLAISFAQQIQANRDLLGSNFSQNQLPILLELRRFNKYFEVLKEKPDTFDLAEEISRHIGNDARFGDISADWMQNALKTQPCLLLLDGLDEIAESGTRQRLLEALEAFVRNYPKVRCILTSRPYGFQALNLGVGFQRTEVQAFNFEDIKQFINHWYNNDLIYKEEVEKLIQQIDAKKSIKELAQNPLLCTIIAIVYHKRKVLPHRRVELYEDCCEILLSIWEDKKEIQLPGLFGELDWNERLGLLIPLAYQFHQQTQQLAIKEQLVIEKLAQTLKERQFVTTEPEAKKEARYFVTAIRDRSGLLQGRGDGTLEFTHRTFQEYLAARYIASQEDYIDLIMAHLHEAWWREVHLLATAHLGTNDDGKQKVERLLLTILNYYPNPSPWLLPSKRKFFNPARWKPRLQWQRCLAWHLMREFEFAAQAYADCTRIGRTPTLSNKLSELAFQRVEKWADNPTDSKYFNFLITTITHLQTSNIEKVVTILVSALQNDNSDVKLAAAGSLVKLEKTSDKVVIALLGALQDKNEGVRYAATDSLGRLNKASDKVVSALLDALRDKNEGVRYAAADSLGRLNKASDEVVTALLGALQDKDENMRYAAVNSLGKLGEASDEVVTALLGVLQDKDENMRYAAANSLGELGEASDEAVTVLLGALQDKDENMRYAAANSLGRLGEASDEVVTALLGALQDKDEKVRYAAANSLGKLEKASDEVVTALLGALQDKDEKVRYAAANSLGNLEKASDEVVTALLGALRDKDEGVRSAAADSLGNLGKASDDVVIALLDTLQDEDSGVRDAAADSLENLGKTNDEEVVTALLGALRDKDSRVRYAAAYSLEKLGKASNEVVTALLGALQDKNERVRYAAANSLVSLEKANDEVVTVLLGALQDKDEGVRYAVADSLGNLEKANDEVVMALLGAFRDKYDMVRYAAVNSLGQIKIENEAQLESVLITLTRYLHEGNNEAFFVAQKLLDGRPLPGYRWKTSLPKRMKEIRQKFMEKIQTLRENPLFKIFDFLLKPLKWIIKLVKYL